MSEKLFLSGIVILGIVLVILFYRILRKGG